MSISKNLSGDEVIELIRRRTRLGVKRNDPFLTLLLVALLEYKFRVECVDWDD